MKLLSKRASKKMTRAFRLMISHTYTWQATDSIPVLDGGGNPTYNEWDQPITTDSYPIPGNPCLYYQWVDASLAIPEGTVVRGTPALYVPPEDKAVVGDSVFDVMTNDGTIIYPAGTVVSIDPVAMFGNNICKILHLSGAVTS